MKVLVEKIKDYGKLGKFGGSRIIVVFLPILFHYKLNNRVIEGILKLSSRQLTGINKPITPHMIKSFITCAGNGFNEFYKYNNFSLFGEGFSIATTITIDVLKEQYKDISIMEIPIESNYYYTEYLKRKLKDRDEFSQYELIES